jgi:hypothetical protein
MPREIVMPNQISVTVKKKANKDSNTTNEPKIKKGVGYTTGTGEAWNVSEFLASREARSNQIANIVGIFKHSLKNIDG